VVREALSAHPDADMVSFTSRARGARGVGESAARTVKKMSPDPRGTSPFFILHDAHTAWRSSSRSRHRPFIAAT